MRMFFETPDDFLAWTTQAIRGWAGREGIKGPIFHIHGRKDRLIPCRKVEPDEAPEDGGHTIILTHPREVSGFIRRCIRG
jgi:pimeloyl-ACP methyl ester carboxylesterase